MKQPKSQKALRSAVRHRYLVLSVMLVLGILMEFGGPARAQPAGYKLTLLLKTGDTIDGRTLTSFRGPLSEGSINDVDTVVFEAFFSDGFGIFTQSALLVKNGDTIGGKTLISVGVPVINNSATVAFIGDIEGGPGIFTQSALVAKPRDTVDGKTLTAVGGPSINDKGTIAFMAQFADSDRRTSGIVLARPLGCAPHTIHGHLSTVPPGHLADIASHQHHGQHGHTLLAGCPSHVPGHGLALAQEHEQSRPDASGAVAMPGDQAGKHDR